MSQDYNFIPKRQDKNTEKFYKIKIKDKKHRKKSLRDLRGGRPKKGEESE